jgi:hypothetical protein
VASEAGIEPTPPGLEGREHKFSWPCPIKSTNNRFTKESLALIKVEP